MNKRLLLLLLPAFVILSGCSGQVVKTAELKKPNRFAIVSVNGTTSGFGMTEAEEIKLMTDVDAVVSKELAQTKDFKLVSSSLVKQSRSYAAMKGEDSGGTFALKAAQGYKKINLSDKDVQNSLKSVMAENHLTGVIQVTASYAMEKSGLSLSGFLPIPIPISVGKSHGVVNLAIVAMNSSSDVIWRDQIKVTSEEGITTVMGVGHFADLYPKLIDISQQAVRTAMKNLDDELKK